MSQQHRTVAQPRQRGALSAFVAVMAVFFVMMAVVVAEGGRRLANISRAEDLASEAARAAAATLDVEQLARGNARIDDNEADGARVQAEQILVAAGDDVRFRIEIAPSGESVVVDVVIEATSILPLFDVHGHGSHTAAVIDLGGS